MGGECWYCHWGWAQQVYDIFLRATEDIEIAIDEFNAQSDWKIICEPESAWRALEYGPAHIVWSDENWDSAEWCLKYCDRPEFLEWNPTVLEIVRRSLRELAALPDHIREAQPADYHGEHPENYPPAVGITMVGKSLVRGWE